MSNRVDQLEYTVMELGTEVFRLKSQITEMSDIQGQMSKVIKNLKDILDEKGLITGEDFEMAHNANFGHEEEAGEEDFDSWLGQTSKVEFH